MLRLTLFSFKINLIGADTSFTFPLHIAHNSIFATLIANVHRRAGHCIHSLWWQFSPNDFHSFGWQWPSTCNWISMEDFHAQYTGPRCLCERFFSIWLQCFVDVISLMRIFGGTWMRMQWHSTIDWKYTYTMTSYRWIDSLLTWCILTPQWGYYSGPQFRSVFEVTRWMLHRTYTHTL